MQTRNFLSVSLLFTLAFSLNAALEKPTTFQDRNYLFVSEKLSYEMAKDFCVSRNLALLSMDTEEERKYIADQLVLETKAENELGHLWVSVDNGRSTKSVSWCSKKPTTGKTCAMIKTGRSNCLDTARCSDSNSFICEGPKPQLKKGTLSHASKPLNTHKRHVVSNRVNEDKPEKENVGDKDNADTPRALGYCVDIDSCGCHEHVDCAEKLEDIRESLKTMFTFAFTRCNLDIPNL